MPPLPLGLQVLVWGAGQAKKDWVGLRNKTEKKRPDNRLQKTVLEEGNDSVPHKSLPGLRDNSLTHQRSWW